MLTGHRGPPQLPPRGTWRPPQVRWLFEIDNTAPEADSLAFAKDHVTTGLDVASAVSVVQIAPPAWQHVVATWDGSINVSGVHLYVDGGETLYGATQAGVGAPNSDAAWDLSFGAKTDGTNALHSSMDEIRISNIARSADWISAQYKSMDDNPADPFITIAGEESGGASWATAAEDTPLTGLNKLTTKRVRIEISNKGAVSSGSVLYRLEVSQANPTTCDAGGNTWTRIDTITHWNMVASTYYADADPTTNINPGLTDENTTFVAGEMKEFFDGTDDDQTSGIILSDLPPRTSPPSKLDQGPLEVHSREQNRVLETWGVWPPAPAADRPRRCEAVSGCTPFATSRLAPLLPTTCRRSLR